MTRPSSSYFSLKISFRIFTAVIFIGLFVSMPQISYLNPLFASSAGVGPTNAILSQSDEISLSYSFSYTIQENTTETDSLTLDLTILGDDLLYGNGSIRYRLSDNIENEDLLEVLGLVFNPDQVEYFEDHDLEDYFETYFSYRRENYRNDPTDFADNASYTLFWLNSSDQSANFLRDFQQIPYFAVSDPFTLTLQKTHPAVASPNWSPESEDLAKNVPIVESYYLFLNLDNNLRIKLYYDLTWSLLLRAEFDYINPNDESYFYSILLTLDSSSLELDYLAENPYWEARLATVKTFLFIGGGILVICIPLVIFILRRRKEKLSRSPKDGSTPSSSSPSLLDRI
ncbi:MAG: hypothetical protein ACTSYI_07045 [Promethearchaeota archaeon]